MSGVPAVLRAGEETVQVERAWPTRTMAVVVEGRDSVDRVRAGRLDPTAEPGQELLGYGCDPALPDLAPLVADGGMVLVHRAGRRAVLHRPGRYLKVVRPGRAGRLAEHADRGRDLARSAGLDAPVVTGVGDAVLQTDELPGRTMHEAGACACVGRARWSELWAGWAVAWERVQQGEVDAPAHTATDEAQVLRTWWARTKQHGMLADDAALAPVLAGLLDGAPGALVPSHRDLHDHQLLVNHGGLGVLDFDTVSRAEPALDLANLAVHARLRVLQGRWAPERADVVVQAVEEVARRSEVPERRLRQYADASWLRLACVYAFRPRWAALAQRLTCADERSLIAVSPGHHRRAGGWCR